MAEHCSAILLLDAFCHGLLVTRWSVVGSDSSPPFLPAVSFSAKSKLNVSGTELLTRV